MNSAGKGGGLEHFTNGVLKPLVLPGLDGSNLQVVAMLSSRDGALWINTIDQGIYFIHGKNVDRFGTAEGLFSNPVMSLFEDREGSIWAATSNGEVPAVRDLPPSFPPVGRQGKLENALKRLARYLHERGKLDPEEAFVDATFASAKAGLAVGPTDSDPLDRRLQEEYGIQMIAPNRASGAELKMAVRCAAMADAGESRCSSHGCTASAASSLDGSTTSRTSLASSTSPAFTCCSDISLELLATAFYQPVAVPLRLKHLIQVSAL